MKALKCNKFAKFAESHRLLMPFCLIHAYIRKLNSPINHQYHSSVFSLFLEANLIGIWIDLFITPKDVNERFSLLPILHFFMTSIQYCWGSNLKMTMAATKLFRISNNNQFMHKHRLLETSNSNIIRLVSYHWHGRGWSRSQRVQTEFTSSNLLY